MLRAVLILAATGFALTGAATAQASTGAVYTQSNAPGGNAVQVLARGADGRLTAAGSFPTGGRGTGSGLGSQGAVALSPDERFLLAVDAGSNEVTAFRVHRHGLSPAGRAPSGGTLPVSVTVRGDAVYVLNAGGVPNVSGLRLGRDGSLAPRAGSTEALPPGAAGPAQVSFDPRGDALVVTERLTDRIDTFDLDRRGLPDAPVATASSGSVPFGFAFSRRGDLVVSEAAASTVSSYRLLRDGALGLISASVATNQGAACWVAITPNGRYAYTANAATGSLSGFAIDRDGSLRALDADGRTASAPGPNDEAVSRDGRFLYAVSPGTGEVTGYRIAADGSLSPVAGAAGLAGRPAGLAAR